MSVPKNSGLTITNWTTQTIPSFKGKSSFVLPGAFYAQVVGMMAEAGFTKATNVLEADVVVFIGGSDINPELYGQTLHSTTYIDRQRCKFEEMIYHQCVANKKVMFGICRGAQFLHAMNGGELWQNVNNHGSAHFFIDLEENLRLKTSSMHHQMLMDNEKLQVLAVCEDQVATKFETDTISLDLTKFGNNNKYEMEIEAGYYPETLCFFTQGHPEVGPAEYTSWVMHKLHDFVYDWEAVNNKEGMENLVEHLANIGSISS